MAAQPKAAPAPAPPRLSPPKISPPRLAPPPLPPPGRPAPHPSQSVQARTAAPPPPLPRTVSPRLAAPALPPAPAAVVQRVKTLKVHFADPKDWDDNASDSESEPEDEDRMVRPPKAKRKKKQHEVVLNTTKRIGKRKHKGKFVTKRKKGVRLVPRVNNRIYITQSWPNLAKDAQEIHDVIPKLDKKNQTNRSFGATTIVCCVLLVRGVYRKLCFSNLEGSLGPAMRDKAHSLGYHAVQAMKSHAESELIQYAATYKNVKLIDMGCDKGHCAECDFMLRWYNDGNYETQTTITDKTFKNYHMPESLQNVTGLEDRPTIEFPEQFEFE